MRIISTKFLCKADMSESPRALNAQWIPVFIKDKWYIGEYELWSESHDSEKNERLYGLNNGWSRYWVVGEDGDKREMPKAYMRACFILNIDEMRDAKIDEILNKE